MSESIENDASKKTEKKIGSYHEVEGFSGENTEKSRDGPEVIHKKPKKLKENIDQYELETDGYRRNRGENANAESDVDRESGRSVGEKGYSGGKVEDALRMGNGIIEGGILRHSRNIQERIRSEGESDAENFEDRQDNPEISRRPEERIQHGDMGTRVSIHEEQRIDGNIEEVPIESKIGDYKGNLRNAIQNKENSRANPKSPHIENPVEKAHHQNIVTKQGDTINTILGDNADKSSHRDSLKKVGYVTADAVAQAIQKARGTISKATGEKDDSASSDVLKVTEAAGGRVTRLGFDTVKKTRDFVSGEGRETAGFITEKSISNRKKPKTESQIKKETNRKRLSRKRLSLQRKAKRAAKAGKTTAEGTKKAVSIGKFMMDTVFHGSKVFIGVIAFVIILMIFGGQSAISVLPTTVEALSMEKAAGYQSKPAWIDAADLKLSALEMGLRQRIDGIEEEFPGYDEYSYTLGDIGHDPYTLINYLSAQYGVIGEEAMAEIDELFEAMYELKFTETEEPRVRWVLKPKEKTKEDEKEEGDDEEDEDNNTDDESDDNGDENKDDNNKTGEESGNDEEDDEPEYELVPEDYIAKILKVELKTTSLGTIADERLSGSSEKKSMYQLYNSTRGLMQVLGSPVATAWSVKSYYGYRRNPITDEDESHKGLDISVPEGTQVLSSLTGTVTDIGYNETFGNYVTITNEKGPAVSYAHLSTVSVTKDQVVAIGEPIGLSGGAGSQEGSCIHMEFTVNGTYFNPLFYTKNGY